VTSYHRVFALFLLLVLLGCGATDRRRTVTGGTTPPADEPQKTLADDTPLPSLTPKNFNVRVYPGGRREIAFRDDAAGDCNSDRTVDGRDLFILAARFEEESSFNGHTATQEGNDAIDGNEDGLLDGKDVFPIALNFGADVSGYRVMMSMFIDGPYDQQFGADVPLSEDYPFGEYLIEQDPNLLAPLYFKIAPIEEGGEAGEATDYEPKQKLVWTENALPVIANIDGSGKRYLIDPDDFPSSAEYRDFVSASDVYLSANMSTVVVTGSDTLEPHWIVCNPTTGEYEKLVAPDGIEIGGMLRISGDGSLIYIPALIDEELTRVWIDVTDFDSWGELVGGYINPYGVLPVVVGNDPQVHAAITRYEEGDEIWCEVEMLTLDGGVMKNLGTFPMLNFNERYNFFYMSLSGNGEKLFLVTKYYPDEEDGQTLWAIDTATAEMSKVFGPIETNFIQEIHSSYDGNAVGFYHEIGFLDHVDYSAFYVGEVWQLTGFDEIAHSHRVTWSPDLSICASRFLSSENGEWIEMLDPEGNAVLKIDALSPGASLDSTNMKAN